GGEGRADDRAEDARGGDRGDEAPALADGELAADEDPELRKDGGRDEPHGDVEREDRDPAERKGGEGERRRPGEEEEGQEHPPRVPAPRDPGQDPGRREGDGGDGDVREAEVRLRDAGHEEGVARRLEHGVPGARQEEDDEREDRDPRLSRAQIDEARGEARPSHAGSPGAMDPSMI